MRLAHRIARAGLCSRREAERLIGAGQVRVDGRRIETPYCTPPSEARIEVRGVVLPEPPPVGLWRFHKPCGTVVTTGAAKHPTVFQLLPRHLGRLMAVGRLDVNSEGLLLLTNHGGLKRHLELPRHGWRRLYRVRVFGELSLEEFRRWREGITLDGRPLRPIEVRLLRRGRHNAWLEVALQEGHNREIRRLMASVGLRVNRLLRVGYGPFSLGSLKPGELRHATLPPALRAVTCES